MEGKEKRKKKKEKRRPTFLQFNSLKKKGYCHFFLQLLHAGREGRKRARKRTPFLLTVS